MAELINLSSDDEEELEEVPKKIMKLIPVSKAVENKFLSDSCILLDDDDDVKIDSEPPSEKAQSAECEEKGSSEDVECVNDWNNPNDIAVESEPLKVSTGNTNNGSNSAISSNLLSEVALDESSKTDVNRFLKFLDDCMEALKNSPHKDLVGSKLPIIKKFYDKLKVHDQDLNQLNEIIQNNTVKVKKDPKKAIVYFGDVYQWLKSSYTDTTKTKKTSEHNQKIIKKLEKMLYAIRKKIRELEQTEIDFDDEDNSVYMQMDRYMTRASKIYDKLCHYREENPHYVRLLFCRLDFSSSNFCEINQAINKEYKSNAMFPTYLDIDKLVRKCVQQHNLKISEKSLEDEIKRCFEKLGNLLQKRRQMDLYSNQMGYIHGTSDPGEQNPEIYHKIHSNQAEASKKLDEVMEKYTQLQKKGVNPDISSESEDSNLAKSGSDYEQNENNATEHI